MKARIRNFARRNILAVLVAGGVAGAAGGVQAQPDVSGFSPTQTARVVSTLEEDFAFCREQDPVYRVDCYQKTLASATKVIEYNAAYRDLDVAFSSMSRDLFTFVRKNLDGDAPRGGSMFFRLKPVKQGKLGEAKALLRGGFSDAQTTLRNGSAAAAKVYKPVIDILARESQQLW